jgi:hypothetical protein
MRCDWGQPSCRSRRCRDFVACQDTIVTGATTPGGYADYVLAHARASARSFRRLSVGDVAPKACAAVTMFNSLRRTRAGPGDLVAILRIGGLGHFGIRFAVQMGFRTVAIARGTESAVRADELGAHYPGRRRRPGPHRSDRSGQYLCGHHARSSGRSLRPTSRTSSTSLRYRASSPWSRYHPRGKAAEDHQRMLANQARLRVVLTTTN